MVGPLGTTGVSPGRGVFAPTSLDVDGLRLRCIGCCLTSDLEGGWVLFVGVPSKESVENGRWGLGISRPVRGDTIE